MIYRCIFKIFLFTKMLELLRGTSYIASGTNAALLFAARGACRFITPYFAPGSPYTPPYPIAVFMLKNGKY
jgi:hypothetical protein